MSSTGAFQPQEFDVVQDVFKRIAREPWFSKDINRQHEFAGLCLRKYQEGTTEPDRLLEACLIVAREHYADLNAE
jgi:hypothetical protein